MTPSARRPVIALLGTRDEPVDAIQDYTTSLASALGRRGIELEPFRLDWTTGRWAALWLLWRSAAAWRDALVLVQYTALQWSVRGFPGFLLVVRWILRLRGAQLGIVFHDPGPFPVRREAGLLLRMIDLARRLVQVGVMRAMERAACLAVFTVPLECVGWLRATAPRHRFVPVGSNLPMTVRPPRDHVATVAVFAMSSGVRMQAEVTAIAAAVRCAAARVGHVRLRLVGRNVLDAHELLVAACRHSGVEVVSSDVLPPGDVSQVLAGADVCLFVRGHVSSRRGSVVAALALGLPVVGYRGVETGPPITDAGVVLVPEGDEAALAEALAEVLADPRRRSELGARSRDAWAHHFDWDVIAGRFAEGMRHV